MAVGREDFQIRLQMCGLGNPLYLPPTELKKSSDEKYKGGPANDIQLIGILEEELFFPAPCDDEQNNAAVYKYTVDKIVKGEYKKNQILLIETCPEIKGGRFFRKNVKYKITANINKYNSYDWVIFNYYQGSDIPVYWSITIEKSNY